MNTWQIVLICWLCYGIGFVTGYYLKSMFDKDEDNPLWTKNEFKGNPPKGFVAWNFFLNDCHNKNIFSGMKIEALNKDEPLTSELIEEGDEK